MNEYQEMEGFRADNNSDDSGLIGVELHGKRWQKRTHTEDDNMFASGDSDSDDERSESKKRRNVLAELADYSKPVGFVSIGSVVPGQETDRDFQNNNEEFDENKLEFGSVSAGLGIGIGSASSKKLDKEEDEDDDSLPTAFGKKIVREERENEKALLSKNSSSERESDRNGVTKDIGLKLLEKIGNRGGSIGKYEQGILAPMEPKLRPKNMEISSVLDRISERSSLGALTLESISKSFVDLQTRFPDEYTMFNLPSIAFSYALPFFIRMFSNWDPLQNPTHGLLVVSVWKKLLHRNDSSAISGSGCPFTQLLMEAVFPAVRISFTNSWQAREPEPMLRFLKAWEELLPPPVLQTVLDTIVMPKISAAVESWDPSLDTTITVHSWIHPWLPLLGHKLDNYHHTIRVKLASALDAWHPSDSSAYHILSPWRTVFDPVNWEQLMAQYIIPKLMAVMHDLPINPSNSNQNLDQFSWVLPWLNAVPTYHRRQLMDAFFYRMQEMLYHWLCTQPDFEEAREGYQRWKGLLPPELQANKYVRFNLNIFLDMMNRAADGMKVQPPESYLRVRRTAARAA